MDGLLERHGFMQDSSHCVLIQHLRVSKCDEWETAWGVPFEYTLYIYVISTFRTCVRSLVASSFDVDEQSTRNACTYISRCTHGPCMIHLNHHSYHISLYNLSFWRDRNQRRLPLWSSVHFKSIIRFCHWYICWPAIDTDFAKFSARNFLTTWHMLIHHWYWPYQIYYSEKLEESKWHIQPFTACEPVILSMLSLL